MMETNNVKERFKNLDRTKVFYVLLSFLTCLFVFPLFDSILYFGILSVVLISLSIIFTFNKYNKDNIYLFVLICFPIVIFSLIAVIGFYGKYSMDTVKRIFAPICVISFISVGYLSSLFKNFKVKYLFYSLFIILFITTLVNLISTMISFPILYGCRYSNYNLYYDGQISRESFDYMAKAIVGNVITYVDLGYYYLFPSMLLSLSSIIFFSKYKENKTMFIFALCGMAISIWSLFYSFSVDAVLMLFLILCALSVSISFIKFKNTHHGYKITLFVVLTIAIILFTVYVINAQQNNFIYHYTSHSRVLDYLFNKNRYSVQYVPILKGIFSSNKITGYPIYYPNGTFTNYPSGNYFIDQIMYTGFFGLLIFVMFSVVMMFFVVKYLRIKEIDDKEKYILLSFVLMYFLFSLIGGSVMRKIFVTSTQEFYAQPLFLISLFLLGYISGKSLRKEKIYE